MASEIAREEEIRKYLSQAANRIKIDTVFETGSTNDEMKKRAKNGEKELSVLIAEHQTAGKGRRGRSFFSPEGTGIYMSFLLFPEYLPEQCTLLTTMAATVTATAIEKITGKSTQLKWVNDVYMQKKKVAGILTEAGFTQNGNKIDWAVVGIGINLTPPQNGFPDEIINIAGTVCDSADFQKNRLIAEIINGFFQNFSCLLERKYLTDYRKRLFFLGQEITVIEPGRSYTATAVDIDDMCHLVVKLPDGNEKILSSGEISIKPSLK